jgi:hypothetical protein
VAKPKRMRPQGSASASAAELDTEAPLVDDDTLAIFQNQNASGIPGGPRPVVGDAVPFREGIYASTKGAHLVNDGIGYGELTIERFYYADSAGKLTVMIRRSVRTRTGRQTIMKGDT